jgi:holo-[acyl-carrier protein] synthase
VVVPPGGAQVKATRRVLVGLDLVQISSIASSVERFGNRFLNRIFTKNELLYCMAEPGPSASRLAARFAAKEAVLKILCLGDEAIGWRSIEVVRASSGWCDLVLHGRARALALKAGCTDFALSMTHESDYASAVVVCERRRERGGGDEK